MSRKPSRMSQHLLRKLMVAEETMSQTARVDFNVGKEHTLRVDQMLALKQGRFDDARAIHAERVLCLTRALEALTTCPVCEDHPSLEETAE